MLLSVPRLALVVKNLLSSTIRQDPLQGPEKPCYKRTLHPEPFRQAFVAPSARPAPLAAPQTAAAAAPPTEAAGPLCRNEKAFIKKYICMCIYIYIYIYLFTCL